MVKQSIVAKNAKMIIKEKCLKQNAVGEKAGYSQGQFNNLLNGRKTIAVEDVLKLCEVLEVTPNKLFENNRG